MSLQRPLEFQSVKPAEVEQVGEGTAILDQAFLHLDLGRCPVFLVAGSGRGTGGDDLWASLKARSSVGHMLRHGHVANV